MKYTHHGSSLEVALAKLLDERCIRNFKFPQDTIYAKSSHEMVQYGLNDGCQLDVPFLTATYTADPPVPVAQPTSS